MTIRRPDPRGSDREREREEVPVAAAVWVRPYLAVDAAAVRALVERVLSEFDLALDPRGVDRDLEDVDEAYRRGGGEFWIVEGSGGRLLGTCGVWPDPRDRERCELRKMYLDQALRGRGIGRQLLELALGHARSAGFRRMELETNHAMAAAIALYQGAGFVEQEVESSCAARCDRMFGMDLREVEDDQEDM
jgi:GNAT superfamily N-acetyltransferase